MHHLTTDVNNMHVDIVEVLIKHLIKMHIGLDVK